MKKKIWVLGAIAVSAALTFNCKKGGSDADAKAAVAEVNKLMADSIAPLEAAADGAALRGEREQGVIAYYTSGAVLSFELALQKLGSPAGSTASSRWVAGRLEEASAPA